MFQYGSDHLTTSKALQILNGALPTQISQDTRQQIQACHENVIKIANGKDAVYGINTGFGPLCNTKIPASNTEQLQRNLLISHSVGVGNPIAQKLSKLMLILKIHSLCKGYSGISMEIIARLQWHLDEEVIPVVPEQGSVGASGDLAPLSHLFLPLIGEGQVFYKNEIVETSAVLKEKEEERLRNEELKKFQKENKMRLKKLL